MARGGYGITPAAVDSSSGFAWEGEIPAQKWMNFYTKVVSGFATGTGVKLTLRLEVRHRVVFLPQKSKRRTLLCESSDYAATCRCRAGSQRPAAAVPSVGENANLVPRRGLYGARQTPHYEDQLWATRRDRKLTT